MRPRESEIEPVALAPRIRAQQQPAFAGEANGKPPVARIVGTSVVSPRRTSFASVSASCRGSNRAPTVSGFPVSRVSSSTPCASSQSSASSNRSGSAAGAPGLRPGTARGRPPRPVAPGEAAREQHRAARTRSLLVDDRHGAELAPLRPPRGRPSGSDTRRLFERERRLVLDVLEPDALREPDEHGERVRCVHEVLHLDVALLGCRPVVLGESTSTAVVQSGDSGSPGSPSWNST